MSGGMRGDARKRNQPEVVADAAAKLARIEALVDEIANDRGIVSPDSRYTRDVIVRELRGVLDGAQ